MTDYLRVSGMYWGLTALDLLDQLHTLPENDVIDYIRKCQDPDSGGISGALFHDPHLLHTLCAVQVTKRQFHYACQRYLMLFIDSLYV